MQKNFKAPKILPLKGSNSAFERFSQWILRRSIRGLFIHSYGECTCVTLRKGFPLSHVYLGLPDSQSWTTFHITFVSFFALFGLFIVTCMILVQLLKIAKMTSRSAVIISAFVTKVWLNGMKNIACKVPHLKGTEMFVRVIKNAPSVEILTWIATRLKMMKRDAFALLALNLFKYRVLKNACIMISIFEWTSWTLIRICTRLVKSAQQFCKAIYNEIEKC